MVIGESMKLAFETWLAEQRISVQSLELFQESITCYKSSAYRATFLFSYLGFQTIVRDRITRAEKPSALPDPVWAKLQADVRDDDKWDATVYEAIQRRQPVEVFALTEDLRNQVTYFKNRRNDCAHGKNSRIDYSHVESFWLFIQSNIAKFAVVESRDQLINQIKDLFDRSVTPPNTDYSHIIIEIPNAVSVDKLSAFFDDIHGIISKSEPNRGLMFSYLIRPEEAEFFNKIFDLNHDAISKALFEYLREKDDLLLAVLRNKPNRINYFFHDPPFLRKLWYEKLFVRFGGSKDYPVFCEMLRNGLIPEDQRVEAFNHLINNRITTEMPEEMSHVILNQLGFYEIFKDIAFARESINYFSWGNSRKHLVIHYLTHFVTSP